MAARLLKAPLASVTADDAGALFEVLLDDEPAYAYYFPRLVELAVAFTVARWPDLPAVLERARRQRLLIVPEVRRAIGGVRDALRDQLLGTLLHNEIIEELVQATAWIEDSLQPLLDAWAAVERPGGQANLAAYVLVNLDSIRTRRRLRNDREWDDRPQLEMEVGLWLRSTALMNRVCHLARSTGEARLIEACAGLRDLHTAPTFP